MERMGKSSTQVATAPSPVVRRRELAALLRELRTEAGLTVEEVAGELLCSPSKVSRMETGQRTVSLRDIRDLCALYRVSDPALREHLTALAKSAKEHGWWQPYEIPSSLATYVGFEADAIRISNYEPGVIPGLLQTPEYARAVHDRTLDRPSDETIDQMIEVRSGRQAILTREDPPPPEFRAIVDEGVLHRVVGSPAIMGAALQYVLQACDLPNVGLRVLSYEVGAHPALDSTFVLLEFRDPLTPVVYVEGLVGRVWLERPQEAERYERVFESLRMMSLSDRDSVDLIAKFASEYKRMLRAVNSITYFMNR
ncbi:MAG TPA: helix-turn-helix transcriptional regulator [Streptosporangiaceae bacterium]|jgi:transcriptional regulator with XRE-family HTH domain